MNNKINTLAEYRTRAQFDVEVLAYLLKLEKSDLIEIEGGKRAPNLHTTLLYHILFGAHPTDLYTDAYADFYAQVIERSKDLTRRYQTSNAPKSTLKLIQVQRIVNLLEKKNHVCQ